MDERRMVGVSEVRLAIGDDDFDVIVEALRAALTIPKFKGFGGCDPCRSGLDRIIIEDPAWRQVKTLQFG
jgi:hypothetical protein